MPADIIVYALVAAGLVFWLRNILGTRHGDERQRSNPYLVNPEVQPGSDSSQTPTSEDRPVTQADKILELAENPKGTMSIRNKAAESGLLDVLKADRNFDINAFLDAAQEAFVIIVESFGEGDRETLEELLSNPVYKAFEASIAQREKDGETQETEIHAIRGAEVTEAGVKNKIAFITLRFTADETSVIRDAEGEILSGHPDKVTEMHDIWVFGRDIRSNDPRWLVYETRGDFDGDNETVPNSDE